MNKESYIHPQLYTSTNMHFLIDIHFLSSVRAFIGTTNGIRVSVYTTIYIHKYGQPKAVNRTLGNLIHGIYGDNPKNNDTLHLLELSLYTTIFLVGQ